MADISHWENNTLSQRQIFILAIGMVYHPSDARYQPSGGCITLLMPDFGHRVLMAGIGHWDSCAPSRWANSQYRPSGKRCHGQPNTPKICIWGGAVAQIQRHVRLPQGPCLRFPD
ncbi:hypothetical protein PCANC_05132 [Puccinia coronata f. sp. avenae]|uniref:Uncharacterized protein n=1 Tax=Puccinia coronata f. sp. avenae TaxID=200324 RepID=A0A2N5W323_9BASI|nr:hypothetical protein PCANC_05132 [Puccinia coronata f. sp. avenae]